MKTKFTKLFLSLTMMLLFSVSAFADLNVSAVVTSQGCAVGDIICIDINVASTTTEYVDNFFFDFPAGFTAIPNWTDGTGSCGSGIPFGTGPVLAPGAATIITGIVSDSDCGIWSNGTYTFCFTLTAADPAGCPADVTITANGDGYNCDGGCNAGAGEYTSEEILAATALPVEVTSFTAEAKGEENKIVWLTASESNTEFHIIQKSTTNSNNWMEVGRIRAAGDSNSANRYELMDVNPMLKTYYRLVTVDFDQKESISEVISVERDAVAGEIDIYPNPATTTLSIDFSSLVRETVNIKLVDLTGRLVKNYEIEAVEGINNTSIDLFRFIPGVYFVSLETTSETITRRLVKK